MITGVSEIRSATEKKYHTVLLVQQPGSFKHFRQNMSYLLRATSWKKPDKHDIRCYSMLL